MKRDTNQEIIIHKNQSNIFDIIGEEVAIQVKQPKEFNILEFDRDKFSNFDHCRYMLDSEMNICYISTIDKGSKDVICTTNIDKSKQNISVSAEKVVTDIPRKLVLEVNHFGKQWFMQSFEYQMIDLILKKIYNLRGKLWKKM